jgi:hypothetical protein
MCQDPHRLLTDLISKDDGLSGPFSGLGFDGLWDKLLPKYQVWTFFS